ncbi:MAG: hypothetical protein Ct9H90mP18_06260 [Gammaproteobacteria bacterium]|nr:MAG: hypothetical protein Ct9H90mP18_06260 [Gammaproteobacteria bacterium]
MRENKKNQVRLKVAISLAETRGASDWIEVDSKKLEGTFLRHLSVKNYHQRLTSH